MFSFTLKLAVNFETFDFSLKPRHLKTFRHNMPTLSRMGHKMMIQEI